MICCVAWLRRNVDNPIGLLYKYKDYYVIIKNNL